MSVLQRLLGPTTQQQRQQEALRAERNANLQAQDSKFFDELLVDGLITKEGRVNFEKLVEKDSTGYKYQNQIVKLLNQSNKFKQFTDTQEGMDKLGVIAGFRDNEDGTKTIITRRPDTNILAPKTWFASDDPNDLVANLNSTQFEDLIQGNVALLRKRANPNLGQGVVAQSVQDGGATDIVTGDPIAEAGEVLDEIDNAEGINLQEANESMLGIVTDLGVRLREANKQKEEEAKQPVKVDVPEFTKSDGTKRNRPVFDQAAAIKFIEDFGGVAPTSPRELRRVTDDLRRIQEGKRPKNLAETMKVMGLSITDYQKGPRNRLDAPAAVRALSEKVNQSLMKEPDPATITSTSFTLNGELKDGATKEEVQSFFDNNKETIEAISKDGDLINRFREVITEYGVESEEDLNKIPFGTAEAKNVTYQDAAIVLAAYDKQQNFADALYKYMGVYDRKMGMEKTALETDILYGNYLQDQQKYRQELTDNFIKAEEELIPLLFDDKGNYQAFTDETRAKVSNLLNQVKSLPGAPKFVVKNGKYEIQTEGEFAKDSLKGIAGLLFAQAVEVEGSVDFKDWFGDLFGPNDPKSIGNLIDNVRFRRTNPGDPNSPIAEIYFTPAGSNREAKGSLKPGDFTYRFGGPNENAFARNLILYYIQEYGVEES